MQQVVNTSGPIAAAAGSPIPAERLSAAAAWAAAHESAAVAAVPVSSFKGVEYLPAERKWQAYVLDTAVSQVGLAWFTLLS